MARSEDSGKKEGMNLLGSPNFTELGNGRFKCLETGHDLLSKDIDSYSHTKKCRLGLIDFALSNNKPPLNMFKQHPLSRSKLICKLTGDSVNKSEEHIWKHMSGKRFLNKLEREEEEKLMCDGMEDEESLQESNSENNGKKDKMKKKKKKKENKDKEIDEECLQDSKSADDGKKDRMKKKKKKKNKEKGIDEESLQESKSADSGEKDRMKQEKKNKDKGIEEIISEVRKSSNEDSDTEEEDFWMPPVGDRWDHDDGGDRWGSESESEQETGEGDVIDATAAEDCEESEELTSRTKRMSIEIGPSSFAARKKKSKKNPQT